MSIKKSSNHIYDYVIVGSGLSGLLVAAGLSRFTENIALLEGSETFGGVNKSISLSNNPLNNGFRYLPSTELSQKAIHFLENLLGLKVTGMPSENTPLTFENGQLKQFVGFGDEPPMFYEELSYFISQEKLTLKLEPHQWVQLLFQKFKGDFLPRSYVTKFNKDGDKVTQVIINGSKSLNTKNVIFCGSLKDLALYLPEETLSARARHKLSKGHYWNAVCLDLVHNQLVTENSSSHVLNGTTQDDLGPCVGAFAPAVANEDKKTQCSQWVTFVDSQSSEDSEVIAHALKKIKRQIKRAYPAALDGLVVERIFVAPMIGGHGDLKINGDQTLPHLNNLWIASGPANQQKNLVGSLLQAELVLASLGFEITPEITETVSDAVELETAQIDHNPEISANF